MSHIYSISLLVVILPVLLGVACAGSTQMVPTAMPLPTYTPVATQALIPTLSPVVAETTPIPAPTTTALPTYIPLPTHTPLLTPTPDPTKTPSPSQVPLTPTSAPVTPPASSPNEAGISAEVSHVVDGDTLDIVLRDGSSDRVRLLGVDTPETYTGNNANEYGDITDIDCLDRWGLLATEFTKNTLEGREVMLMPDPAAGERGYYDRLLAYVHIDGEDFNAMLVSKGYARVYIEGTSTREEEYLKFEGEARDGSVGLWQCGSSNTVASTPVPDQLERCDKSYPGVCIPSPPPDLDCGEIAYREFVVLPPDPHRFDGDKDGVGCES